MNVRGGFRVVAKLYVQNKLRFAASAAVMH